MEQALEKIRPHASSPLINQKIPATLLLAVESTLKDQKTEPSSTAYFAALLTTLDHTIQEKGPTLDDGDMLPAELYLLAVIVPFVATHIIRANLNTILSLTSPLFPVLGAHPPALRSQISLYHKVIRSLELSQLDTLPVQQAFVSILQLCLDSRPKVRKKAAEVVKDIIASPPSPLVCHPYASKVASWAEHTLSNINTQPFQPKNDKGVSSATTDNAIHLLAFLRSVIASLPSSSIPSIAAPILMLPRLGNPYLSRSAYNILSDIFTLSPKDGLNHVSDQVTEVLKITISSPPSKFDTILASAWMEMLGNAMLSFRLIDPEACASEVGRVWMVLWNFLDSSDPSTRKSAAKSLDALCRCFTPGLIMAALHDSGVKSTLSRMVAQVTKALDSLAYVPSIPELLSIVASLITNLRMKPESGSSSTAAEHLMLPLVEKIANMRSQTGFEYKEAVDTALSSAMRVLGPHALLRILPLNLEPSDRLAGREPRAYLLPLLSLPHPSPLNHFISYFVPLSERMFEQAQRAEIEERNAEAKVWNVLIGQIWAGLPSYCSAPQNLKETFDTTFSQLLSQLLYTQPQLRPPVLKALKAIVDSNVDVTPGSMDIECSYDVQENLAFLQTQAASWLAVLFNVFSNTSSEGRNTVGEVISSWLSIARDDDVTRTYSKIVTLFRQNIAGTVDEHRRSGTSDSGNAISVTQDILLLVLPFLSPSDTTNLFETCLSNEVLGSRDNGVQKRGYKILTRIFQSGKFQLNAEPILQRLDELADDLLPAAKKDRFNLLSLLITLISPSSMHVIPPLIPEAVLGTKEPSEKARSSAFDFIVSMGKKMNEGGTVQRKMIDGMADDADEATANIEEFMRMVAAGLAGDSPHMISATVTAISRLVFEFKDVISPKMQTEILTTLLMFISSANREIVKSVLGFIKLSIHILPVELIRPHLKDMVTGLLTWSHDHKNHFKVKVRHIFERMLRRFAWDEIYMYAGSEEAGKVLVNIKKRKERAKRKKAKNEDAEEEHPAKLTTGDTFEDVVYGSESELDDSEDEATAARSNAVPKNGTFGNAYQLRADDDEPVDLLHGATSRLTSSSHHRRRQPGQNASHFKTDAESGKMIIGDESSEEDFDQTDVAGNAYRETITSTDGFTRGRNGKIKFNKDTKKRRRENEMDEDTEMVDGTALEGNGKKHKQKSDVKLGQNFRAKRAGGDVRKGGLDPYAYLPLSQAAKKGQKKGRISIVNR